MYAYLKLCASFTQTRSSGLYLSLGSHHVTLVGSGSPVPSPSLATTAAADDEIKAVSTESCVGFGEIDVILVYVSLVYR